MTCESFPPINQRSRRGTMRPFNILFALYLPLCFLLIFARPATNSLQAWLLDLATGISMVAMLIAAAIGLARQRDEFQRKMLTESILWGTGGMLAVTSIWGLLEVHTSIPRMDILFNFPIFLLIAAAAKVTLFRRIPAVED